MRRINPKWASKMKEKIDSGTFQSETIDYTPAAKWLIMYLDNHNISVKTVNLGAGVRKIIKMENVCSTCKGKGWVDK